MGNPPEERNPMAEAMAWVSRITTVALEMVLPGIAGQWLDRRWGTGFLALVGFALGISVGLWHLLTMTRYVRQREKHSHRDSSNKNSDVE